MTDFLTLIKAFDARDGAARMERLARLAAEPGAPAAAMVRHLEALAFRLEGGGRLDLAARACDLAASLSAPRERRRWSLAAAETRLRAVRAGRYEGAEACLVGLQEGDVPHMRAKVVAALVDLAGASEFRADAETCVQCYARAHALAEGADIRSMDGYSLATKVKNIRRLQLDALIEAGRFEEAAALHETTRAVFGAGPLAVHDIVSARTLAEAGGATYAELLPERPIAAPDLAFTEPPPPLTSEPGDLTAPPFYLAMIPDCRAFPRSNLVVKDGRLVYDLAAHRRRPDVLLQDGVNPDQIVMAAFGERRALIEEPEAPLHVEAGLSLFGLQSRNYGHWFCEFVPRMLAYNDPRCPDGMPLCIDDHMPGTHEEVVALLDTRARPVLKLPPRPVKFGLLGLAPVPAFFPFEMKPGRPVYDTVWPGDILVALRARILEAARGRGALSGRSGRRLFISRKAFAQRQLVNEVEIADALAPHGFEVITPETMTFLEQVEAFHAADVIVGSSSSALTNGLFCRPDCRILGLIHANVAFNFRGYTSFIAAGGARITFLRGETVQEDGHAFHANYRVAPAEVIAAVERLAPAPATVAVAQPAAAPAVAAPDRSLVGRMIRALPFARRPGA